MTEKCVLMAKFNYVPFIVAKVFRSKDGYFLIIHGRVDNLVIKLR